MAIANDLQLHDNEGKHRVSHWGICPEDSCFVLSFDTNPHMTVDYHRLPLLCPVFHQPDPPCEISPAL